jgi:hypothetical protein
MKRYFPVILIIVFALFIHIGCGDFTGIGAGVGSDPPPQTWETGNIHIRNMSTISGVIFGYGLYAASNSIYLNPSPQPGIPVDTSILVLVLSVNRWQVERAIDNVVIDSASISIAPDQWLLIEGDSAGWSCTWSDDPWQ